MVKFTVLRFLLMNGAMLTYVDVGRVLGGCDLTIDWISALCTLNDEDIANMTGTLYEKRRSENKRVLISEDLKLYSKNGKVTRMRVFVPHCQQLNWRCGVRKVIWCDVSLGRPTEGQYEDAYCFTVANI